MTGSCSWTGLWVRWGLGNSEDLDLGLVLPMTLTVAVVLAPVELEDAHLVAAPVTQHLGFLLRPGNEARAPPERLAVDNQQHLVEHDFLPDVRRYLLDPEFFTGADAVLLAAGLDYRVHAPNPLSRKGAHSTECARSGQSKSRSGNRRTGFAIKGLAWGGGNGLRALCWYHPLPSRACRKPFRDDRGDTRIHGGGHARRGRRHTPTARFRRSPHPTGGRIHRRRRWKAPAAHAAAARRGRLRLPRPAPARARGGGRIHPHRYAAPRRRGRRIRPAARPDHGQRAVRQRGRRAGG